MSKSKKNVPKSTNKNSDKTPAHAKAQDDYVDPDGRDSFSDSDILAKSIKESENETREEKRTRTLAQAEREGTRE